MNNIKSNKLSVLLIGCGKMGGALAEGWLSGDICKSITIIDPFGVPDAIAYDPKLTHHETLSDLNNTANDQYDCVLLATKPQIMDDVCADLAPKLTPETLVLSIAAGKSIAYFENYFGASQPIIRTMPNTPAAIGQGITVACPNGATSTQDKKTAARLLQAGGMVEWLDDEGLLDSVTAVSGSGPAYIFHQIEILEKTALKLGLPSDLSAKLARQTVIGSAALAAAQSDTTPATLRQNVTSPGGTTAAALEILMDGRLEDIYTEALSAARSRGQELGRQKP